MVFHPLTDRHYTALGKVAVELAEIEFALAIYINALASDFGAVLMAGEKTDYRNFVLITGETLTTLLTKFEKILEFCVVNQDILQKAKPVLKNLGKANADRNKYLHTHVWIDLGHESLVGRLKFNKYSLSDNDPVTVKQLEDLVESALSAKNDLHDFMDNQLPSIRAQYRRKKIDPLTLREIMGDDPV